LAEFVEFMTIVCRKSRDGEDENDKKEDEEGDGLKIAFVIFLSRYVSKIFLICRSKSKSII